MERNAQTIVYTSVHKSEVQVRGEVWRSGKGTYTRDHHLRMLAKIMAEDSDPKLLFSGTIYFISDYSSVGR